MNQAGEHTLRATMNALSRMDPVAAQFLLNQLECLLIDNRIVSVIPSEMDRKWIGNQYLAL